MDEQQDIPHFIFAIPLTLELGNLIALLQVGQSVRLTSPMATLTRTANGCAFQYDEIEATTPDDEWRHDEQCVPDNYIIDASKPDLAFTERDGFLGYTQAKEYGKYKTKDTNTIHTERATAGMQSTHTSVHK